jgi:hypothetical protein
LVILKRIVHQEYLEDNCGHYRSVKFVWLKDMNIEIIVFDRRKLYTYTFIARIEMLIYQRGFNTDSMRSVYCTLLMTKYESSISECGSLKGHLDHEALKNALWFSLYGNFMTYM